MLRALALALCFTPLGGCIAISVHANTRPAELVPALANLPTTEVEIDAGDNVTLRGIWVEQDGPSVLVLYGSGMTINSSQFLIRILHDAGYGVLCCDYRGVGKSSGRRSSRRLDDDARVLWDWLRENKRTPAGVVGVSIGAVAATGLLDHPHPPAAIVLERLVDPRTVIRRFLSRSTTIGGWIASWIVRPSIDVKVHRQIAKTKIDTLLLLPADDFIMPPRDAARIIKEKADSVEVATLPGGHLSSHLLDAERWRGTLLDFLDARLRPGQPARNRKVPPDPAPIERFERVGRNLTVKLGSKKLPESAMLLIFGRTGNARVNLKPIRSHTFRIRLPWRDCRRIGKILGVRMVAPDFPRPYATRFLRGIRDGWLEPQSIAPEHAFTLYPSPPANDRPIAGAK